MLRRLLYIGFVVTISCAPGYENFDDERMEGNNTSIYPDLAKSEPNFTRRKRQYWHESFNEYDYRRQNFGDNSLNNPQDFSTFRENRDAFYGSRENSYDKPPPHYPHEPPPPPPHHYHLPPPPPPHRHHPPPPSPHGHEPPPRPYDHHPPPPYHEHGPPPLPPPSPHEHHPPPPPPYGHHPPPPPPDHFHPTPPYHEKSTRYEERQARQTTFYERQNEPPPPLPYRPFHTQGRWSTSGEGPPIVERGPPPPGRGPPSPNFGRPPPPYDWGPPPGYSGRPPHGHRPPPRFEYEGEPYRPSFPPPPPRDNYYQPSSNGDAPWKNTSPSSQQNFDKPHRPSQPSQDSYGLSTPERVTISLPTYDSNNATPTLDKNKNTGSLEGIITEFFKVKQIKQPETSNKNESIEGENDSQSMIDIRFGADPKFSSHNNKNVEIKTTSQKNENISTSPNTFTLHYYQVTPVTPPN